MKNYMTTEKEKMVSGEFYNAFDEDLAVERKKAKSLCIEYNKLLYSDFEAKKELLKKILGKCGNNITIEQNFFCDYGYNIEIGENFYSNHNLVILDCAKVEIGKNVAIGPNCGLYTAIHPINAEERIKWVEKAEPINIGDNVWLGGNVVILPGVTIGKNTVIGAGSVVTKNIPENVVAVGNPCRVIKKLK